MQESRKDEIKNATKEGSKGLKKEGIGKGN